MKYAIGIDLGTTNTELAYCCLDDVNSKPTIFEIPQFVAPSTIESRQTLPSFLYVGSEEERSLSDWKLPWDSLDFDVEDEASDGAGDSKQDSKEASVGKSFFKRILGLGKSGGKKDDSPSGMTNPNALYVVGELASARAATFPEQTVASAKSWLTNSKVDRRAPILPYGSPSGSAKVSPVEATRRYLAHLVSAWNNAFPDSPIFEQQVVLTIPASFDESARKLTHEAAIDAGLNPATLLFLEEPQAALYAWLAQKGDEWRKELKVGDVILVCDVGGGTSDFSLVKVEEEDGNLVLDRLAVGNRLLLGGDNIDLAIAYRASELFAEQGISLNPWQSSALQRQCRFAKEKLLSDGNEENSTYKITVLGRSSRLVGDSVSVDFPKKDAVSIVLDGFFPICSLDDRPKTRSRLGLRETGLPYEVDSTVTRHLAKFISGRIDDGSTVSPTHFLLNGGVFKSKALELRFQEQMNAWFPDTPPRNMHPDANLDLAVSYGAAYYAAVKKTGGVRIRAASARSYYIGIESSGLAIPGVARPLKALCVAPFGMEEGTECVVPSDEFELVVGEPALFRFFSSTSRPKDKPGTTLDWFESDENSDLQETTPIETALSDPLADANDLSEGNPVETEQDGVEYVSVRFRSVVTELGSLEIWCEEIGGPRRWKLEFSVREQ